MSVSLTGKPGTATRILDIAQRMVQERGFNAFSYGDVAEEMKVTKASLHYHFPSKAILGEALLTRYISNFVSALTKIDANSDNSAQKLQEYTAIYQSVIDAGRCCFCCMLSADYTTLPPEMQQGVRRFFYTNRAWLSAVLERGIAQRELDLPGPTEEVADFIVASLEGAMLTCWVEGGAARFARVAQRVMAALGVITAGQAPILAAD